MTSELLPDLEGSPGVPIVEKLEKHSRQEKENVDRFGGREDTM